LHEAALKRVSRIVSITSNSTSITSLRKLKSTSSTHKSKRTVLKANAENWALGEIVNLNITLLSEEKSLPYKSAMYTLYFNITLNE